MNSSPTFSASPPALAPRGVAPNLRNAFGGIWRISYRRVFSSKQLLGLMWMVLILAALAYVSTRDRSAGSFYDWMISFYLVKLMPIIAFLSGAAAIREDMKPGGVDYLLTRPVPRPAFVVSRFISHLVCVQCTCLLAFAALIGIGFHRGIDNLAATGPTLWLAQAMTVTAFMALGFLFGSMSARYLVLGISYGGIIEMGLGQIPIALSKLSVLRHVKAFLLPLTPDAGRMNFEPQGALVTAAFLLLFTLVWLGIAAVVFSIQEFAGQRPKDA